jgi:hypothetical protein
MCFSDSLPSTDQTAVVLSHLDLTSCQDITVTFNGGQNPEDWSVTIGLAGAQTPGLLEATKTHANGGTWSASLPVDAQFMFERVSDNQLAGPLLAPPVVLQTINNPAPTWLQAGGSSICGGSGFFPGFDEVGGEPCCRPSCHAGPAPGHLHCTYPPDCPPCPVPSAQPPDPEPGGPPCNTSADCVGDWVGADCVDGICYVPKNRYLSIDPTTNADPVAYKVTVTDGAPAGACFGPPHIPTRCETDADCAPTQTCEQYYSPGIVGREWWLDEPKCFEGNTGTQVDPAPNPSCTGVWFDPVDGFDKALFGWISRLSPTPVTRTWVEVPLHVTDCGIAPLLTYDIRASTDAGASFSDPLEINTIHDPGGPQFWGDLTETPGGGVYWPPGAAMNFDDISAAIETFSSLPFNTGPPQAWAEMETDHVVNFSDIDKLIKAFEGTYYRDIGPLWNGQQFLIGGDPVNCP